MRWFKNLFKNGIENRQRKPSNEIHQVVEPKPTLPIALVSAENIPSRPAPEAPSATQIHPPANPSVEHRARRAIESLLENEALTTDLDDNAAKVLLKWAAELVREVASSTTGLDDQQAEEAMSERLRATQRLLRAVNKWSAGQSSLPAEEKNALFLHIDQQLGIIHQRTSARQDTVHLQALLDQTMQQSGDPAQVIEHLRQLYESPPGSF